MGSGYSGERRDEDLTILKAGRSGKTRVVSSDIMYHGTAMPSNHIKTS